MNKKMKKLLIILISVLMLLMLVGCSSGGNKNETPSETQTTETVEGRTAIVFKHYDGKAASLIRNNETQETYEGMRLMANDELVTDKNTTIYLRVDDDKNILLDKDTSMKIKELKDGKLQMELNYGAFFFDVENKLQDGEDMSFEIGGTTMSIRGTSGQGELRDSVKSFSIFTGLGHVEDGQGMAVDLKPGVQVSTDTKDNEGRYRLSLVGGSDILDATKQYLGEKEEYKNKVDDSKWVKELNGEVVDDSQVELPTQKGWILAEDGSWVYVGEQAESNSETNTNNNTGYRPPIIIPVYEPEEEEPVPAPAPTPEPTPTPEPKNICEYCGKEIVEGEEAKHASISSEVGVKYILEVANEEEVESINEIINSVCKTHHICELKEISYEELCKHVVHCSTEIESGGMELHYICEDNHIICEDEKCDNCNKTSTLTKCEDCGKNLCLSHYNLDEQGNIIPCPGCGKKVCINCQEEKHSIDSDNHYSCAEHVGYCNYCGNNYEYTGEDHHKFLCETCGQQTICVNKMNVCEHCKQRYCPNCEGLNMHYHCETCGKYRCDSDFEKYHKRGDSGWVCYYAEIIADEQQQQNPISELGN